MQCYFTSHILFSNVILTFHQQEVESNSSFLVSGLALVTCLTNRIWQKWYFELSEARSQEALQLPPGPPSICSGRVPLWKQLTASEKAKPSGEALSRGSDWQALPTTSTNPSPTFLFRPLSFWKAIMIKLSPTNQLNQNLWVKGPSINVYKMISRWMQSAVRVENHWLKAEDSPQMKITNFLIFISAPFLN